MTLVLWDKFFIFVGTDDTPWSDRQYQLAMWAFRKWKYHQFTSLRVSVVLFTGLLFYAQAFHYGSVMNTWRISLPLVLTSAVVSSNLLPSCATHALTENAEAETMCSVRSGQKDLHYAFNDKTRACPSFTLIFGGSALVWCAGISCQSVVLLLPACVITDYFRLSSGLPHINLFSFLSLKDFCIRIQPAREIKVNSLLYVCSEAG